MRFLPSARLAVVGVAVALLSLVFTGVPARPLLVAGVVLLVMAGLEEQRTLRREIRAGLRRRRAAGLGLAVVVIGLVGFWATQPFFQRRAILGQLAAFSDEGRRLEADFARVATSNQPQGGSTSKIEDWHLRVETWVATDLGMFYKSRLATPQESPTYPAQLPVRLRVFWDILETDLAAMKQFETEFSGWLF